MNTSRHLRPARAPFPDSSGFTLLEALIALLVLSIGLLGLAALQTRGLAYSHDAYLRSQATFLAYDIIERMRARKTGIIDVDEGKGISPDADVATALNAYTNASPTAGSYCGTSTEDASANNEVYCWQQRLKGATPYNTSGAIGLPGGTGTISQIAGGSTTTNATDDYYQVVLTWKDRSRPVDSSGNPYVITQTWTFQP